MARDPDSDAMWRDVLATYRGAPAIEVKRMFGSDGLMIEGHLACFVSGAGALVAKLPADTALRLRAEGVAAPMVMRGRPMREWLAIERGDDVDWFALVAEAVRHVRDLHA